MQVLGILKEVSVVFPPLQAATAGLFRVLEQFEVIYIRSLEHTNSKMAVHRESMTREVILE
jgi:hypothetical protein